MASSSSVAAGEDPAAPAKGEKRTKKRKRVVLPQSHLDSLMTAEEFLEPLLPRDEEFLAQRRQRGYVEMEVTDDDDDDDEEGGNRAPPAGGRGPMEEVPSRGHQEIGRRRRRRGEEAQLNN
jgi:hypothetical protein